MLPHWSLRMIAGYIVCGTAARMRMPKRDRARRSISSSEIICNKPLDNCFFLFRATLEDISIARHSHASIEKILKSIGKRDFKWDERARSRERIFPFLHEPPSTSADCFIYQIRGFNLSDSTNWIFQILYLSDHQLSCIFPSPLIFLISARKNFFPSIFSLLFILLRAINFPSNENNMIAIVVS